MKEEQYERLYHHLFGLDGSFAGPRIPKWETKRIPPSRPADEVYRSLPYLPDREIGGYLTKTRIRYVLGLAEEAFTIASKPCTFHSHPSHHSNADVPSFVDVYNFLSRPTLRSVTRGSSIIWVFDKTAMTVRTIKRLNAWGKRNMVSVARESGIDRYRPIALSAIGLPVPSDVDEWKAVWHRHLEAIGIGVTIISAVATS